VRLLLIVFLLSGCSLKEAPKPSDTLFDPKKRDWLQIYAHEIKVAIENNDHDAFRFFWPEYVKELSSRKNK